MSPSYRVRFRKTRCAMLTYRISFSTQHIPSRELQSGCQTNFRGWGAGMVLEACVFFPQSAEDTQKRRKHIQVRKESSSSHVLMQNLSCFILHPVLITNILLESRDNTIRLGQIPSEALTRGETRSHQEAHEAVKKFGRDSIAILHDFSAGPRHFLTDASHSHQHHQVTSTNDSFGKRRHRVLPCLSYKN